MAKSWIPTEMERRAVVTLVDAAYKTGSIRNPETADFLNELKRRAAAGLPPLPEESQKPNAKGMVKS